MTTQQLAKKLVNECTKQELTVATAESCTGGSIAKLITDIAGSSAVLAGGFVTYTNDVKINLLGVDAAIIARDTEVSSACAIAMAEGARARLGTALGVSTTGFAGPTGGTAADPVGTVYIAIATKEGVTSTRLSLSSRRDRAYIREVAALRAVSTALAILQGQWQNS